MISQAKMNFKPVEFELDGGPMWATPHVCFAPESGHMQCNLDSSHISQMMSQSGVRPITHDIKKITFMGVVDDNFIHCLMSSRFAVCVVTAAGINLKWC